jgi:hypothetical protein
VPARRKSSAADVPQRNILLLEEYDALAAAISSALKKFAPQHFGAVACSLAEAEKLASELAFHSRSRSTVGRPNEFPRENA